MSRRLALAWAQLRVALLVLPYRAVVAAYRQALDDLISLREIG